MLRNKKKTPVALTTEANCQVNPSKGIIDMNIVAKTDLTFQNITFEPIYQDGQLWFTSTELAKALGYSRTDNVNRVYARNSDEFTDSMTTTVKMTLVRKTGEVDVMVRVFSLRGAQFTAASVGAVLAAATGMGLPAAINAGAAMISFLIGIGYSSIPSDVYFKGKRCVSKSTGKIYYRYKGSIYKDSSHTQAMVKNLSWSRRWGH